MTLGSRSRDGRIQPRPCSDLVEEVVPLRGRDLRLLRPRDAEALLDEDAFEHEEFLPVLGGAVAERLALAARDRRPRAARRAHARARLRARAAEHRRRAGRRSRARHRLVAAGDRAGRATTPSATAPTLETLVCAWTEPGAAARARAVGPRARRRRALRAPQRRRAAARCCRGSGRRGVARRPRPPAGRPVPRAAAARLGVTSTPRARAPATARSTGCEAMRPGVSRRTCSARVATPPRRRRRCGTPPSNSSASPSSSAWTVAVEVDLERRRGRRRAAPRRSRRRPPRATAGCRRSTRARAAPTRSSGSSRTPPGAPGRRAARRSPRRRARAAPAAARRRPQRAHRHAERPRDPLHRARRSAARGRARAGSGTGGTARPRGPAPSG